MDSVFSRKCLDVLHARSVMDFTKQIVSFAQELGFDTVGAAVITEHSPSLYEFQSVSTVPDGYRKAFENGPDGRLDAVNQHCKRSNNPIVWNRQSYSTPAQQELWEMQAQFGFRSGVAFAMHPGRGRHYLFGANWNHDQCEMVANYRTIFEDLLVFGAHSQVAAFGRSTPTPVDHSNSCSLSKSELESLCWTMDGLTSWEVGQKMATTRFDATLRLRRVMQKLDCGTKYEAVLKGIKLGLIEVA
jgi:DNA-binding CsgD family transcriptional regulator